MNDLELILRVTKVAHEFPHAVERVWPIGVFAIKPSKLRLRLGKIPYLCHYPILHYLPKMVHYEVTRARSSAD